MHKHNAWKHRYADSKKKPCPLKQPHVHEDENDGRKEQQPHLPAHTCTLRHQQHPVHRSAQTQSRRVEAIVHFLREGRRVSNFVANGHRHLHKRQCHILSEFSTSKPTSLRVLTLPSIPVICESFWLSSSLSVASLYCPLLFGVAALYPDGPPFCEAYPGPPAL